MNKRSDRKDSSASLTENPRINPEFDDFACRLTNIGRASIAASNALEEIKRPHHILQYTTSGSGAVCVAGKCNHLSAGDVLLVYPDEPFIAEFDDDQFVRLYFRFDVHRFAGPSIACLLPEKEKRVYRAEEPSVLMKTLMNIKYEFHACQPWGTTFANARFTQIIVTILRGLQNRQPDQADEVSRRKERAISYVKRIIEDHCCQELTASRLAHPAQMSPTYLRKLFKQFTGYTIHEYTMRCRLERSAMLMVDNRLPIKQIADSCGFSTVHHFTRRFTQHFGKSPAAYSKEILDKVAI